MIICKIYDHYLTIFKYTYSINFSEYETGKKTFIFLECDEFQLDWHHWSIIELNWSIQDISFSFLFKFCTNARLLCSRVIVFSKCSLVSDSIKQHSQCFAFSFLRKQFVFYARKVLEFLKEKLQNSFYHNQLRISIKKIIDKILYILRYINLLTNLWDFVQISCSASLTYSFLILSGEGRIVKRPIQNIWRLSQNDLYFSMIEMILIIRRFGIYIGNCVSENTWYIYINTIFESDKLDITFILLWYRCGANIIQVYKFCDSRKL